MRRKAGKGILFGEKKRKYKNDRPIHFLFEFSSE
jgi:hypothetical protein